jgi:hypothetical protein
VVVRLFLAGERVGPQLGRAGVRRSAQITRAQRGAARDVVDYVVPRGRVDIAGAGRFGARWTQGFRGQVTEGGGFVRVAFTMPSGAPMRYWRVFEFGAVIRGRPLLWIPLSFARDAQGIRARDYPGRLFRVDRKSGGAPLLLATGKPATPKYFGKESVTIPRKFHLRDIIRAGAQKMREFYAKRMKNG